MASFDFIEASSQGYGFVWEERRYLLQVAFPVIFVKVACHLVVFLVGAEDMFLRQGLIFMPGYVLEAIFMIALIRYFLFAEPIYIWGKLVLPKSTEQRLPPYEGMMPKGQAIRAAILMYMILKVIESAVTGAAMDHIPMEQVASVAPESNEALNPFLDAFLVFAFFAVFIWAFRLLWLYIPLAMGYPLSAYFKKVAGFQSSLPMAATWFICFMPLVIFLIVLMKFFMGLFPDGSAARVITHAVMASTVEIIVLSVQIVAMSYGYVELLFGKADKSA